MNPLNQPPERLLYSRLEAARALCVHPNTIGNLARRGELRPVRIGSRVLFDRADLLDFIDRAKAGARPGGST